VLLCGDSRADKRDAALLIERIAGLRCVDCGKLEMARITESLTAMLIAVNSRYKAHAGSGWLACLTYLGVMSADIVVLAGGTGGAKLARACSTWSRIPHVWS